MGLRLLFRASVVGLATEYRFIHFVMVGLASEIYKTKHNLNPSFMSEIFETRNIHYK